MNTTYLIEALRAGRTSGRRQAPLARPYGL